MTADFRSDTVTRPSAAMRAAILEAEVGDDVLDGDPTVRLLEEVLLGRRSVLSRGSWLLRNALSRPVPVLSS